LSAKLRLSLLPSLLVGKGLLLCLLLCLEPLLRVTRTILGLRLSPPLLVGKITLRLLHGVLKACLAHANGSLCLLLKDVAA
jgi:hypothetical protein